MANPAVEAMLSSRRTFVVAAAGCGKTELLSQFVADQRSGRQLVLTHTHAGLAAIKSRLAKMRVPHDKYHLDTIAGWCLRYCAAYPAISGFQPNTEAEPDWSATYPGTVKVCRTALGKRIIEQSYDGVLVDEYQDCTVNQHAVVQALGDYISCRGVGDPLQTIFGFDDPVVTWSAINEGFDVVENALCDPWRWRREGCNTQLGDWLITARQQLETNGQLVIEAHAPVRWVEHANNVEIAGIWATACRSAGSHDDTVVAILKWPNKAKKLARQLGGRWPLVERFDDPDLLRLGLKIVDADGPTLVTELVDFIAERMTGIGTDLKAMVEAIKVGRSTSRFTKNREHVLLLEALAKEPTPMRALSWLERTLNHRDDWWLYRRECVYQLRSALRGCSGSDFIRFPDAVAAERIRARHRGRPTHRRTIGTPLLVKGLEFDHAVLLWEPDHLSTQGLYVAITRASKSLTIVSQSRQLIPAQR